MKRVAEPREQKRLQEMRPAFFQGFLVSIGDERQSFMPRKYRDAKRRAWFEHGKSAGVKWLVKVTKRRSERRWQ
jgi:hypothetical protein